MKYWFSSDFHLGHKFLYEKSFRHEKFSSIKELDEAIVNNILSLSKKGDNFYFLGDLFFKYTNEQKNKFFDTFSKAGINFFWITGNHDKNFKHRAIKWMGPIKNINLYQQNIILFHYPMVVWNRSHYGSWQLFGHIHKGDHTDKVFDKTRLGKQLNVNLEFWDFKPLSFEEIVEYMKNQPNNFDLLK